MSAKYDHIGVEYNRTRTADPYLVSRLAHHLQPTAGNQYLDIGCGTGNYTAALSHLGGHFTGVDPSEKMLAVAKAAHQNIDWLIGSVEDLPIAPASIHGIVASLTLHHWTDLTQGFSQLAQTLLPKGRLVVFTSTPAQMHGYWLNHYFPKMLADSIAQMPAKAAVIEALNAAGFEVTATEKYAVRPDLQDLFLYAGKQRPALYLDADVRQGISSFSALANAAEVADGLSRLEADLVSGKINDVMSSYANDKGDYLFIAARR